MNRKFTDIEMPNLQVPHLSPRLILAVAGIILGGILVFGTFYQIEPEEVGVVTRFGRYVRTTEPGLHMKLPLLEEVRKVPVQRQLKQEFGFRTVDAGVRTQYASQSFLDESMMLTGDLNVAVVEWIIQYRVTDPYLYLFRVRDVEGTLRHMTEAGMRGVVGDRTVTEVLTVGRQEMETTAKEQLQELCARYENGISIDQVVLQDVNPPDPVKPSWDEVNQAQQQRDRLINEARAEYNKVIPRARGEAEQTILQAEGYALKRVNESQGDAARFIALHAAFQRSPEVTRRRMYLETLGRVLPRLGGKVFVDADAQGIVPFLPVERLRKFTGQDVANGRGEQ